MIVCGDITDRGGRGSCRVMSRYRLFMDLMRRLSALQNTNPTPKGANLNQEVQHRSHQEGAYAAMGCCIEGGNNRQYHYQDYSKGTHSRSAKVQSEKRTGA